MKRYITWTIGLVLVTLLLPQSTYSQSVKRQSIGSYGSNGFSNSAVLGQTIGQPYSTITYIGGEISLTPGFQQPIVYLKSKKEPELHFISLKTFPNPANAKFTIKSQELLKNVELQISDINGRLILSKQLSELSTYTVYCSSWQASMYFISVTSDNLPYKYSTKLILTNQ
jgi:hypothetical protein